MEFWAGPTETDSIFFRFAEGEGHHGGVNPDDPNAADHAKRLADQLRQMISDGVTDDCSICLDALKAPVITSCAHVYCKECIERVIDATKPPLCPLCRGQIKKADQERDATGVCTRRHKKFSGIFLLVPHK